MATFEKVMVDVVHIAVRNLNNGGSTSLATAVADSTTAPAATTTGDPSASQTSNPGGGSPATQSPLLFFVALGFGVVFTNLWIIVGVKYCFRYNARNRAIARGEEPDIDMQNIARPHRRRREKKLMSMEEVNQRFPMMKYKTWTAERASKGLPTEGGVVAQPSRAASRAASVRSVVGVIPAVAIESSEARRPTTSGSTPESTPAAITDGKKESNARKSVDTRRSLDSSDKAEAITIENAHMPSLEETATTQSIDLKHSETVAEEDTDEEEDHIPTALSPDVIDHPGDTCAICIDTLEEDDDIRGLTCGHAFHAGCLDPWLTSRRASCPLCKADYYVPKPRPEGEAAESERPRRSGRSQPPNMPTQPRTAASYLPRLRGVDPFGYPDLAYSRRRREAARAERAARGEVNGVPLETPEATGAVEESQGRRFFRMPAVRMPNIRLPGRRRQEADADAAATAAEPTPGQLEAGTARS